MPIDRLVEAERNPKAHDDEGLDASLERFGYIEPIVMDERTGRLVSGHGRLRRLAARRERGEDPPEGVERRARNRWWAPVNRGWRSADDDEAKAAVIALNRIGERGGWLRDPLAEMLAELNSGPGLGGTGYSPADLDTLLDSLRPPAPNPRHNTTPQDDHAPPIPEHPVTRRGDVWMVGPHRIMCGDCRMARDVRRLIDKATVNLAVTSPPYARQRDYDEASGFQPIPPDLYVDWFDKVQANVASHLADDGSWLVNIKPSADTLDTSLYVVDLVAAHVRQWGWHFATEFCWERAGVPKAPVLRLKNQFEPVYQFARGRWKFRPDNVRHASDAMIVPLGPGAGNTAWDGSGDRAGHGRGAFFDERQMVNKRRSNADRQGSTDDVWFNGQYAEGWAYPGNRLPTFAGSHEATGHPAAFPVGLPSFFTQLFTDKGDVVFDPFMGSGSSVLAAHQHGRVGLGMELSPGYCDVALARIERSTGLVPRRPGGEEVSFLISPGKAR